MYKMTRRAGALAVACVSMFGAAEVEAQQWNSLPALSNVDQSVAGRAFWNNRSDDGLNCNIGFILNGEVTTGACENQRPDPWLPFAGSPVTQYFSKDGKLAQAFMFSGGVYRIEQLGAQQLGGDVAGSNANWGVFSGATKTALPTSSSFSTFKSFTSSWGFWIDLGRPTDAADAMSDDANNARQFALLAYNPLSFATLGNVAHFGKLAYGETFYVGLEDNACTSLTDTCPRVSDFDNNDVVFAVTAVPEPGTYALMLAGLAGLFAANRRRKNI